MIMAAGACNRGEWEPEHEWIARRDRTCPSRRNEWRSSRDLGDYLDAALYTRPATAITTRPVPMYAAPAPRAQTISTVPMIVQPRPDARLLAPIPIPPATMLLPGAPLGPLGPLTIPGAGTPQPPPDDSSTFIPAPPAGGGDVPPPILIPGAPSTPDPTSGGPAADGGGTDSGAPAPTSSGAFGWFLLAVGGYFLVRGMK